MLRVITGGNMWSRVVANGYGVEMGGLIEKEERSGRRAGEYHQDPVIY